MTDRARIIEVTNKWFIVEFDLEENEKLAKDLNDLFFIKGIERRRVQKKQKKIKNRAWLCDKKLIFYL